MDRRELLFTSRWCFDGLSPPGLPSQELAELVTDEIEYIELPEDNLESPALSCSSDASISTTGTIIAGW